jgi:CCDC81-like prokaryotic HU domain 2/CCDC81-like prokaryotic HU domain 1/SPOR domain
MKIDLYISQLLYRYQCVTVPGFGAFLTEIQSAQLHESSHSFYPPKKLVSFNSYLKNNDGLLANHIAQAEKMSYEVAVATIENQVISWKSMLQDLGAITLKNIGELSLNSEKNLVFVPYDQLNYLTDSFGLTSYVSPAIKREVYNHVVETQKMEEEKAPIELIAEPSSSRNYMKYAAIFVLGAGLISAGGFFGNEFYQNKIQQETLAVQTKVQNQVNQKIQEATFFISNPIPSVTLTVKSDKLPYHIVAGVFTREQNAEKMYNLLVKQGYEARRVAANRHGMFPVFYGSYSNYAEAQKEMNRIKRNINPDTWLMIDDL